MQQKQHAQHDPLAVLLRLSWWSGVVDELASCPIEEVRRVGNLISFFIDTRRCQNQLLPRFPTAARRVGEMNNSEKHDLVAYLIRLHKARFVCAIRAEASCARCGWPKVNVVGDEVEFQVPIGFVRQILEVDHD